MPGAFVHGWRDSADQRGRDGFPGPTAQGRVSIELYNLADDPGERKNIAELRPDVVESLLSLAESYRERLGDADRVGSEQREPGQAPEAAPSADE